MDDDLGQVRGQVWQNRQEISAVDNRLSQRIAELRNELDRRVGPLENHFANQAARHARTPQLVFGVIGAIGTVVAVIVALRGAGLL